MCRRCIKLRRVISVNMHMFTQMKGFLFFLSCCIGINCAVAQTPKGYTNVTALGVKANGGDVSAALQSAVDKGVPLFFPAGRYLVTRPIKHSGIIKWLGSGNKSIILCDDVVLQATNAGNSVIDNIRLQNVTTPWVVVRNEAHIGGKYNLIKTNTAGYQPTVNDGDIWPSLTPAQQQQDIGPKLTFNGRASNIKVTRVYGNFVSILLDGAINSTVSNCKIKGGKNAFAAILFANLAGGPGSGNKAIGNTITYASFCGIAFIGNNNGTASGNSISGCGESGIKLYQGEIGGYNARCSQMTIINNASKYNTYDGLDVTTNGPRNAQAQTAHTVTGNQLLYNGGAGIYADGSGNLISGNTVAHNYRSGIDAFVGNSRILKNKATDNNISNTATGVHELTVNGSENEIMDNVINRSATRNGYGIYATDQNDVQRNTGKGVGFFFGPAGRIKARLLNNSVTDKLALPVN
jgi:parallel beta-helix repeat protein